MNIKNEQAHQMARELAALTGETITAAVTQAVLERLERIRRESSGSTLSERLLAIGKDAAPRFREPYRSIDHGDLLYDERGLPHED
jgi:antitoxin VapB